MDVLGRAISGGSARISTRIAAPQQPQTAQPTITHASPRNTIASTRQADDSASQIGPQRAHHAVGRGEQQERGRKLAEVERGQAALMRSGRPVWVR